jgi:2-polyprenyl-6-methoxyphenol hydroxylase-like FAD-dependent oxidoreductase
MTPVYNGWYISDKIDTSSVSAKQDYYSCRGQHDLPFDYAASSTTPSQSFSWIPITSSILPTGGCGVAPPPSVQPSPGCASLRHVVIQRPIGDVLHLYSPTTSSVAAIKLHIQKTCRLPAHCQSLFARNCHCNDDATLDAIFPATNREACFFTLQESTYIDLINAPLVESCRTIAIIGGGPVGLWIALQVKLLAESWDVHVFEKRDAYARNHALRLLPLAFDGLLREHGTSAMCDMVDRWLAAGSSPRTNVIENELSDQCEAAGVQIHRKQGVVLVSDVKSRLVSIAKHTLSACVCCDGVGSMNRPLLLSADQCEFAVDENFEGVGLLQVKFQTKGRVAQVKGTWAKFLQNLPASEVVFNILAGNYDACSDTTPVTVFAMLTDRDLSTEFSHVMEGVESFKGMSFDEFQAHSYTPHTQQLVLDISAVLRPLFPSGLSHDPAHPLRISRLPVRVCIASRVVGNVEGVPVFIAGDAAMGLSLEKGLSYGWHLATALCKSLRFCTSVQMAQEEYAAAFDEVSVSAQRHVEHDFHAYESLVKRAGLLRNILKKVTLGAANSQFVLQKASQKAISKNQQKS